MPKVTLITHPETEMDKQGRVHGNLDPPLSYSGKVKAKLIANSLKDKNIDCVYCSPRKRAMETAQEIAKATGAKVEVCDELIPWDLGTHLSGSKVGAISPLLEYYSNHPNKPVSNGGEPKSSVLSRFAKFTKTLKDGDVVVGHSQHSLAWDYARSGGDAAKVPMFGAKSGEVKEIKL